MLKLFRVLRVLGKIKYPAKFQHRISMHYAVMRICISHRLSICAQKWDFEGEYVKILCSDPYKGTTLREYASVGVSRVKIGSTT